MPSLSEFTGPITFVFRDPNGGLIEVVDVNDQVVRTFNLANIPSIDMTEGLFPDGKMYVGFLLAPGSQLLVNEFYFHTLP